MARLNSKLVLVLYLLLALVSLLEANGALESPKSPVTDLGHYSANSLASSGSLAIKSSP